MDVYSRTSRLMEKYNVEDISLLAGGGEYPSQDGFGWTNGVLLKLMNRYNVTASVPSKTKSETVFANAK
jgi:alpha,alpha-trehalase